MKSERKRLRELGIKLGRYEPGPLNAITDVFGVRVGQTTLVHTGVTAILPTDNFYEERPMAGGFILNGAGECTGFHQIQEWGILETPIVLTNTHSVGTCYQAVLEYMLEKYPAIGHESGTIIPVIAECDDSWLNEINSGAIQNKTVFQSIENARTGFVSEGNVGAGTGMVCFDFKGGIGTSSRKLSADHGGYTLGVLVQSNFGNMREMRFSGASLGEKLWPKFSDLDHREKPAGSVIVVIATDAPLLPHQLNRLSRRAALGIGRTGTSAAHSSGEIILAFSTKNTSPRKSTGHTQTAQFLIDENLNPLFEAVAEATEEAIFNSLCAATEMVGRKGHLAPAFPSEEILKL